MTPGTKRLYSVVAVAVVAMAVTVVGLYAKLSDHAAPDAAPALSLPPLAPPVAAPGAAPGAMPGVTPGAAPGAAPSPPASAMDVAAERLAKRLTEKDGSADDWALLARSYMMLNRYSDAVGAFDRALAKTPGNAALAADRAAAQKAAAEATPPR